MTEEHPNLAPTDDEHIDVKDAWQVLWWCRMMNVTKTQLEAAVESVGTEPALVRQQLALDSK